MLELLHSGGAAQKQQAGRIARSSLKSRGLIFAFNPAGSGLLNLARPAGSLTGTLVEATSYGRVSAATSASTSYQLADAEWNRSAEFTALIFCRRTGTVARYANPFGRDFKSAGAPSYATWAIELNQSGSNQDELSFFTSNTADFTRTASFTSADLSKPFVAGLRRSSSAIAGFFNGRKVVETTGISALTYASTGLNDIAINGIYAKSPFEVYLALLFNRAVPDGELNEISRAIDSLIEIDGDLYAIDSGSASPIDLVGDATSSLSAAGDLTTAIEVTGAAVVSGQAAGSLSTAIPLDGVAVSAAVAAGELTTQIRIAGAALAAAGATGGITTSITLSGAAIGQALAAGELAGSGTSLAGAATGGATAAGALTTQIRLAGAGQVAVVAAGGLTTTVSLAGAAVAVATATGDLVIELSLGADAVAAAQAGASLTTSIVMSAAAVAGAQASASLTTQSSAPAPGVRRRVIRIASASRVRIVAARRPRY